MKPLDFVKTPKGGIAIITEVNFGQGLDYSSDYDQCSISFIGDNDTGEKNAWWDNSDGLVVIDNLAALLARKLIHPFGKGKVPAEYYYP